MLKPLLIRRLENEEKVITYSPRRLAKAFYCGKSAYHDRFSPGSPLTKGIEYGSAIDSEISKLVSGKEYKYSKEIEFYVLNTPSLTDDVKPSQESKSNIELTVFGEKVTVLLEGLCDVLYPNLVVEVKTGKQKKWHEIQALCYAVAFKRICQVIYVTRGYSIFVEPDEEKLKEILLKAIDNEVIEQTSRNEFCEHCVLKKGCFEWDTRSGYIKAMGMLKQYLTTENLDKQEEKDVKECIAKLSKYAHKYINAGESYRVENVIVLPNKDKETGQVRGVILKSSTDS
jgi:hypothetical protein